MTEHRMPTQSVMMGTVICSTLLLVFTILALNGAFDMSARPMPTAASPADSRPATSSPSASTPTTLTPAGAMVLQACANAVLVGEGKVTMEHLARIDDCAARTRAALLDR